jgi:methyl-accepting chemotaxis protein
VSWVLATLILAAGVLKLFGYVTGVPIRLDALLFRMELREVSLRIPNQMAPNTAANFVLVGLAILLFQVRWGRLLVSNVLAFGVVALGLLSVLGYTYGVTQFSQLSPLFIPMALHTAAAFLLLGIGLLFGSREFPLPQLFLHGGAARVIAIRLFPAATLLVIGLGWLRLYGERKQYFPNVVGTALFVVVMVFLLTALVLWTSITVARAENVQREAESSLRSSKTAIEESNLRLQLIMNHAAELIGSFDRHMPSSARTLERFN